MKPQFVDLLLVPMNQCHNLYHVYKQFLNLFVIIFSLSSFSFLSLSLSRKFCSNFLLLSGDLISILRTVIHDDVIVSLFFFFQMCCCLRLQNSEHMICNYVQLVISLSLSLLFYFSRSVNKSFHSMIKHRPIIVSY